MLNFNVDPYYDDFDPSKNFHRILFKPGNAVQARELTQSQTILQSQISKFADNIFTQNTPVTGGRVTTNLNCHYLKLVNSTGLVAGDFLNQVITDSTGTILAKVIQTSETTSTATTIGDPPTLIVSYLSGLHFGDGDSIFSVETNNSATLISSDSTGKSSTASISEGVFYVVNGYSQSNTQNQDGSYTKYSIGNFVSVQPQTVILNKYSNTPSYRVGLSITETIYDYINDSSLLDPAIGASNYQAPGADRYLIELSLTTLPLTVGNDDQFIELLRINEGNIEKQVDGTVYSVINDYISKRDYETNGDYIVNDFKITPAANTLNSATYDLKIGKGIAYVQGYRIENQSDLVLVNDRSRETDSITNNSVYTEYGNYLIVDTLHGTFDVTTMPTVDLHLVGSGSINSSNTSTYNSTLIGKGYIRNLSFVSATNNSNTQSYIYKAFINDFTANTLSSNATSGTTTTISFYDTTGKFSATSNAYYGVTLSITSGTSSGDRRRIVSYNGSTKVATVDSPFTLTPDATSKFSLIFGTKDIESVVNATGTTVNASANINIIGKQNSLPLNDTVLESIVPPELLFNIGYPYVSALADSTYTSTKVFRNKTFGIGDTFTISIPAGNPTRFLGSGTLSGDTVKDNFIVIDTSTKNLLDFSTSGNTITISAGNDSATFSSATYTGKTVNVIAKVFISNADSTNYILKSKNLVVGNSNTVTGNTGTNISNTYVDTTNGQVYIKKSNVTNGKMSLYVSDVKKIRKIIDTKDAAVIPTDAMLSNTSYDVTAFFNLDNGQRDNFYDHASISLVPGVAVPKGNLLVIFDFYSHSGGDGYFSVESYLSPLSTSPENYGEIPKYTSKNKTLYNLRDVLDFRPTRKNAQASFAFDYTTPVASTDAGILIPVNGTEYISDYSYYLARKDKLVLSKDRNFQIIQGAPAIKPIFPDTPDGSMLLLNLTHDPYTAYIPGENTSVMTPNMSMDRVLHKRWAKKDISDLESRVNNLEYYTSMSLLEQNAQSLQVSDVNGLNRFKNGILVDDFSSYLASDTTNPAFNANINLKTKKMTALQLVDNYSLTDLASLKSLGTLKETNTYSISNVQGTHTNIYTLPYSKANTIVQPLATSIVSLNPFSVAVRQGVMKINPPMDNWVTNRYSPTITVTDDRLQVSQQQTGKNLTNMGSFDELVNTTTDNSSKVLPYIRAQQLVVRAKGMALNTPVSCFFDGQNVNYHMVSPNTLELKNVSGTFNEDDIIGFYQTSNAKFYALGRVVSVHRYSSTQVRLYISPLMNAPAYASQTTIKNATYDSNGNYTGSTATGTINADLVSYRNSGQISGVGGGFTVNSTVFQIYKTNNAHDWCTFLNQYGVWGDLEATTSSSNYYANFTINVPKTDTFTITVSATSATSNVNIDGVSIGSITGPSTTNTYTKSIAAGNRVISWGIPKDSAAPINGFACVVKDSTGNIVFESTNPPGLVYDSVGVEYLQPGGGAFFTGVRKIKLEQSSSSVNDFYVGTRIVVSSKQYVQQTTETATYVPPPPPPPQPAPVSTIGGFSGGFGCCFTAGTKITLSDGSVKNIEDVLIGDKLIGKDGMINTVLNYIRPILGDRKLLSLNGRVPYMTNDHPVWTKDGKWKSGDAKATAEKYEVFSDGSVEQLVVGDVIETLDGEGYVVDSIDQMYDNPELQVYNFEVDGNNTYVANNLIVHNKGVASSCGGGCSCGCGCFVPGTIVTLSNGTTKKIEDVLIGDKLVGKDGMINTVVDYFRPTLGDRTLISFNGGTPFITDDHPIYMQDGTWKSFNPEATLAKYVKLSDYNIGKFVVGDIVQTIDGKGFEIKSIEEHSDSADLQLYNFSLDGNHTYTANELIVHNKCFIAGTEVLMEDGSWKDIEDVDTNEVLIGKDGSKNKVIRLHRPKLGINDDWLPHKQRMVSINGIEFAVSEDHMFLTTDGWKAPDAESCNLVHKHTIAAEGFTVTQLEVGDFIVTDSGDTVEVKTIVFKEDDPELQLYNFWLDGNHTYHVRMKGSDKGMLVHNKCFIAGTRVLMKDGSWKNIEDVELGEELLGENNSVNRVKNFHRPTLGMNNRWLPRNQKLVSINGSEFSVSCDHMIKTTDGWKAPDVEICNLIHKDVMDIEGIVIKQLKVGDEIIGVNGDITVVKSIEFKDDDASTQLYNFKLENSRTYHVKLKGSEETMLVHNKGGCFTGDTMVSIVGRPDKKISEVVIGDLVYNKDRTSVNEVVFIERMMDTDFGSLYSPTKQFKPFATINHPLYIDGKLSSVDPEANYTRYPWLGMNEKLVPNKIADAKGQMVYNLWTTGDGTYTVNGYGTSSMVGDGGMLRLLVEQGHITSERVSQVLLKFESSGEDVIYGAYLTNKLLGKMNIKLINKVFGSVYASDDNMKMQKAFEMILKLVGKTAWFFQNK